jgi:hypothetical protein
MFELKKANLEEKIGDEKRPTTREDQHDQTQQ